MEPFGSIHFPPGSPRRRPSLPLCNLGVFASLSAFLFLYVNASTLSPVDDLHIVNKEVAPDGFSRPSVLVNAELPAPLISALKGDRFTLNVHNELEDLRMIRSTTIHWHGLFQYGTAWNDGPAFITQCPIVPGDSFLYDFSAPGQTGTYWYHSHLATQYCDGLRGPFVIYDPDDPYISKYDVDDESTVITLADWYHFVAPDAPPIPTPNSTLINGRGRYAGGPKTQLAAINVEQGKRYRIRLVSLSCDPNYNFTIPGHDLTIIEIDGVLTHPLTVSSIQIFTGQRYSFILHANQPIANYWILANPNLGNQGFTDGINSAVLHYAGAPMAKAQPSIPTSPDSDDHDTDHTNHDGNSETPEEPLFDPNEIFAAVINGTVDGVKHLDERDLRPLGSPANLVSGAQRVREDEREKEREEKAGKSQGVDAEALGVEPHRGTEEDGDGGLIQRDYHERDEHKGGYKASQKHGNRYRLGHGYGHKHERPGYRHHHHHRHSRRHYASSSSDIHEETHNSNSKGDQSSPDADASAYTAYQHDYSRPSYLESSADSEYYEGRDMYDGVGGLPFPGGADINLRLNITLDRTIGRFMINNHSFVPPTLPVLLQILSGKKKPQELLPRGSVYVLPRGKVVEVTIPGGSPGSPHPFHLHGHTFDVVRSAGSSDYNFINPPRRDVVSTGFAGDDVTIRFKTDNPGPWIFHCHIDWHLDHGLAIVFAEADDDIPFTEDPSESWDKLCPQYKNFSPDPPEVQPTAAGSQPSQPSSPVTSAQRSSDGRGGNGSQPTGDAQANTTRVP